MKHVHVYSCKFIAWLSVYLIMLVLRSWDPGESNEYSSRKIVGSGNYKMWPEWERKQVSRPTLPLTGWASHHHLHFRLSPPQTFSGYLQPSQASYHLLGLTHRQAGLNPRKRYDNFNPCNCVLNQAKWSWVQGWRRQLSWDSRTGRRSKLRSSREKKVSNPQEQKVLVFRSCGYFSI